MAENPSVALQRQDTLRNLQAFEQRARKAGAKSIADTRFAALMLLHQRLNDAQLSAELGACSQTGQNLEAHLIARGVVRGDEVPMLRANALGRRWVNLDTIERIPQQVLKLLPPEVCQAHQAVPFHVAERPDGPWVVWVTLANPANSSAIKVITRLLADQRSFEAEFAASPPDQIAKILGSERFKINREGDGDDVAVGDPNQGRATQDLSSGEDDSEARKAFFAALREAVEAGASDLHVEPDDDGNVVVRGRVNGTLQILEELPARLQRPMANVIKLLTDMEITEERVPQDGRQTFTLDGRQIDVRAASAPTVRGEKFVLRILDKERAALSELKDTGMNDDNQQRFKRGYAKAAGAVLVTGPTGSGKTSTLQALLGHLNKPDIHIITVEDPVEYTIPGVQHCNVDKAVGFTFSVGLKAALRLDPEIIMVGEIRDHETAATAMEAAITGHLVLSTLHTNDAATAVTRLLEMGVEGHLIANALNVVVAQRLMRRLCQQCKRQIVPEAAELVAFGYDLETAERIVAQPVFFGANDGGCADCQGGWKGRTAIHEVMLIGPEQKRLIISQGKQLDPAVLVASLGRDFVPINFDGLQRVMAGVTSLAELRRVNG